MMYRIPQRLAFLAAAFSLSFAAACTDAETPTSVPAGAVASRSERQAGRIYEPPIFRAFDVQLTASGSMQPGKPIEVHVRVRANLPVDDAEIVVSTPDLDRPVTPTLDSRFSRSLGKGTAERVNRRVRWNKGQGLTETVRLTIPAPGYYRVTASAYARSELPAFVDSAEVVGDIHREIWLRVDKRGGRYTAQFDTLVFPAEAERRAGPLHCTVELDAERRGKKRDPGCDGALVTMYDPEANADGPVAIAVGDEVCIMNLDGGCGGDTCSVGMDHCLPDPCLSDPYACGIEPYPVTPPADPCYARTHLCIQFVYVDRSTGGNDTVPAPEGMLVEGSYQDRDCFIECWWTEERSTFARTNKLGQVMFRCPSSSMEKQLRTAYEFLDEYSAVSRSEWRGPDLRGACPTGWRKVDMVANQEAFVYGNMRKSGQRAQLLFGRSSPRTRVDFDSGMLQDGLGQTSWYDAPLHTISINDDHIWSRATHAHEYGHSFHNMALGGIGHIYVSSFFLSHTFEEQTNGAKALLEGFAEFFETLIHPGARSLHRGVRWPNNWTSSIDLGPKTEGRVAAYLWDVIDNPDEKGSAHEHYGAEGWGTVPNAGNAQEWYDQVTILPSTLGKVIDECGRPSWGLLDTRPESIEGIHRCLQSYDGGAFGTVLTPIYSANIYGAVQ
jgi:hypothetical protein